MDDTIYLFVGSEPKTLIAAKVLCRSITARTKATVQITLMEGDACWEIPADLPKGTGFSLRRFLIPRAMNYKGRAIYLDADQLVLGDIRELWDMPYVYPNADGVVWCTYQTDKHHPRRPSPQSSVMVINCEKAADWKPEKHWSWLRSGKVSYADFMHLSWLRPQAVCMPTKWNRLNDVVVGDTRLLHYTREGRQPWYDPKHPHAGVWQAELELSIKEGYVTREMFEAALAKWNVKEDWRSCNGLHPFYKRYLPLFASAAATRGEPCS